MTLIGKTGANLFGFLVPMMIGFACFPVLVDSFGVERFGLITLMWILVSYSGVVDLGLSRAIVIEVGAASGCKDEERTSRAVAMGHGLACVIGAVLGVGLYVVVAVAAGLEGNLTIGGHLIEECVAASPFLAMTLPFVAGSAVLRGELEGRQKFGWANVLRVSTGTAIFIVPIVTFQFGNELRPVALGFLIVRVVVWFLSWAIVNHVRGCRAGLWPSGWQGVRRVAAVGGWLTVTYVVSPVTAYVDRFIVLSLVGPAALAAYTAANEVVTKMWLLPTAATAVLLPEFSRRMASDEDAVELLIRAQRVVLCVMGPVLMVMVILAEPVLDAWLGKPFGAQVEPLLRVLCIGMIVSCLSQVPATACLSLGAARGLAVLQIMLMILIVPVLLFVVARWGAMGAAWAWVGRIVVDQIGILRVIKNHVAPRAMRNIADTTIKLSLLGATSVFSVGSVSRPIALAVLTFASLLAIAVLHNEFQRGRGVAR